MISTTSKRIIITIFVILIIVLSLFFVLPKEHKLVINQKPSVEIKSPKDRSTVSNIIMITGDAHDPNADDSLVFVEIKIDNMNWEKVEGTTEWSYEWNTYSYNEGIYNISARSWDGIDYSSIQEITVTVDNPETAETDSHKWAVFIAASNFPSDNESKLGNGALVLMEKMTKFFIENYKYSTSNIFILFDDGWIRSDNGYGEREQTLQQHTHEYSVTYGGATQKNVELVISRVISESNKFDDSEVFIWVSSHGSSDNHNRLTGGKIFENSEIFLWDTTLKDKDLGNMFFNLKSQKVCVIVDACYSGGFADKTIFNFPEFFLLKSNIPEKGRVVITGSSKYREGFASTTEGPLFSMLWFEGIKTGDADGFRPGFLKNGRPTRLNMFKDGKVSVEEAFYYARYILNTNKDLKNYSKMQPQINDKYPRSGLLLSRKGLILGQQD